MEGKEFDSFISFKTFLDQYSKESNKVLLRNLYILWDSVEKPFEV